MASKASIAGHPVHPMIVPFPLALWTTSFITDLLFYFTRSSTLPVIAKFLLAAGCIGALRRPYPGIIDWLSIKHPGRQANRKLARALEHHRVADFCGEPLLANEIGRRCLGRLRVEDSVSAFVGRRDFDCDFRLAGWRVVV